MNRQAWVTSAVNFTEVRNALVLGYSLKVACTSRKLVVILSPKFARWMIDAFRRVFDHVVFLEEDRQPDCMELNDFVQLSAIGIVGDFGKCVYLSPNSVAMRNSDDLFDREDANIDQNTVLTNFIFTPSFKMYAGVLKLYQTDSQLYPNFSSKLLESEIIPISLWMLKADGKHRNGSLGREMNLSLVNFSDNTIFKWDDSKTPGMINKLVVRHWMEIFCEHVEPIIEKPDSFYEISSAVALYYTEPIAVVGMACRLPGCKKLEDFWSLLLADKDGLSAPPPFRWNKDQCSRLPSNGEIRAGFLSAPVDEFDARFFGISPQEALYMDPQHRLLLEVVWEALEDAFIDPLSLNDSSGSVFVGSWMEDYKDILRCSGNDDSFRIVLGVFLGSAAARISHALKLNGPSVSTECGCASSMSAVHMACKALRHGESNLALATGVNLIANPFDNSFMPMVASTNGKCKTFCEKADFYARAEGCGALVLKRLSDAVRDTDNIWALIRGSAVSQEGTSGSMGTPTVLCESLAMTRALKDANVDPEDVTYVELHGTGTPVGDPVEVAAIAKAYHSRKRKMPLVIGSVKTNVGHTEACSGITGIIKTILAMHNNMIPAHRNMEKLNSAIDLDSIPAVIPLEQMKWITEKDKPKIAGVSSFGMSGTDSHVILEQSPNISSKNTLKFCKNEFERPLHVLKVSAKSEEALNELLERTRREICLNSDAGLADICHGGNTGRADFNWRAVVRAANTTELAEKLTEGKFSKKEIAAERGKICFLFTGQGSQYPGMALQLYETSPTFRIHFEDCEDILRNNYNIDIREVLWGNDSSENKLSRTIFSQTSIFCVEYALLKLLNSWGLNADCAFGHSLGEFTAAVCAGILDLEDAVMLLAERSRLIDNLPEGKMLVIKADKEEVSLLLDNFYSSRTEIGNKLDFAAINSKEQTVVAGDTQTITEFASFCKNNGNKCTVLSATHAFHSSHIDPILDKYKKIAVGVKKPSRAPACLYISGMKGSIISSEDVDAEYWVKHTRDPVQFLDASREALRLGCRIFIEIGPQPVLSGFIMANISPDIENRKLLCLPTLKRAGENWATILDTLGTLYLQGVPINWKGFDQFYFRQKVRVLPHYPFQRKKFWPENINQENTSLHPLLGSPISNGSPVKLYQSVIQLKSHEYLSDHAIGRRAVFPGSGYLELCMAAGIAATSPSADFLLKTSHPMKVENLVIKAPLIFQEFGKVELQTILDFNSSKESTGEMNVQICKRVGTDASESSWLQHATGKFYPFTTVQDRSVEVDTVYIFKKFMEQAGGTQLTRNYYSQVAVEGLVFGPEFRSLEKVWTDKTEGRYSILTKLRRPSGSEGGSQYIAHPVILDAMAQSPLLFWYTLSGKVKMLLSLKIGKFVWFGNNCSEGDLYVYTYDTQNDGVDEISTSTFVSFLLNEEGKPVAKMSDLVCAHSNLKKMEAMLDQQMTSIPDMWDEVWRPHPINKCSERCQILEEGSPVRLIPLWLLFHQEDSPMSNFLLEKMLANSKIQLLVVTHSQENVISKWNCTIRKKSEGDFTRLFEKVVTGDKCIEGVVYCWTLDQAISFQDEILLPYFYLVKALTNLKQVGVDTISLISLYKGASTLEGSSPINFHQSTVWGFTKMVQSEHPELTCRCIDIGDMEDYGTERVQILNEIWRFKESDGSMQVAYRNGIRYTPKFVSWKTAPKNLKLPPGAGRYQLAHSDRRTIDDLQFVHLEQPSIGDDNVEIQVKATGLNFRDIMCVLKPSDSFNTCNGIGGDFAGIVSQVGANVENWSVGDRVFGYNLNDTPLPSHVILNKEDIYPMESEMSYCEATTLPVGFLTSYVGLAETAKIKNGDTVLIHSASGGVGLCAIQICKMLEASVICTAGSTRKRNYLKSLGIEHVFNSRSTTYAKDILAVTDGRGVDVVLNSLTGEGFKEATLSVCSPQARFVEMSKLQVWTPEEVRNLRPDVEYTVIDVSVEQTKLSEIRRVMAKLVEFISSKKISPLPYNRFDSTDIREALHFLQKTKHIGKVICVMPEEKLIDGVTKVDTPVFNRHGSYLITGGTVGSIGFEVCRWMVRKGAKYVILATRTAPTKSAQEAISQLNKEHSSKVVSLRVDIGDYSQLKGLVQCKIPQLGFPPLKGIIHSAGALSDGMLQNQTWPSLSIPLRAKVDGTLNLHQVTSGMNLEHFVMFSSLAALFGLPGQGTHGAANNFEDAFAYYRHSLGLPAMSINWGQWAEVGIGKELEIPGLKQMSVSQGIAGLEYALKSQKTQMAVANFDSFVVLSKRTQQVANYLDEGVWKSKSNEVAHRKSSLVFTTDEFWQAINLDGDVRRREKVIQTQLELILKNIVGLDQTEVIGSSQSFEEIGVDSLMHMEIGNAVRTLLGKKTKVSGNALRDSDNLHELAEVVASLIG